ncbi:right-handed parallel beta-helix repeat-containing protein [Cryobacterium sp. Hh7]|uniref:right-handed parallel beta-helix repeat-containing protein n=1 Tax=Cryobacterium sp. Hh7 TaxID=1259159 RepID=UPI0010698B02|nr:right-handed parallel beta-helix repeat-containing protein [Cryobacterium sp. Hh7]TFD52869.1 right-handed parallel beta-helix repeat-containing protein [Cryobacterium sp. Hh7]
MRLLPAVLAIALGAIVALPVFPVLPAAADDQANATAAPYPGDPTAEALLVAAEDRRLIDVRAVSNAAEWTGVNQFKPYRLATGSSYTLVLTSREADYSFDDLLKLSPRGLVRQPDGSYLLSENIVVEEGATLNFHSNDGLALRLVSSSDLFVSIVTMGGSLTLGGSAEEPLDVSSWDPDTGTVDTDTSDGRAYIRVIGGHASFSNTNFHHLGFWSGMTGGVSLTGTELPATTTESKGDLALSDDGNPIVYGQELIPAGPDEAQTLDLEPDLRGYSYVSASITSSHFDHNAFGLFVTSAEGVDVHDSEFSDNMVNGLVFHRHVTNSRVSSSASTNNALDGFALSRATTGVIFDGLTSSGNGRNGVSIDGRPLAEGPNATGNPTGTFGNNTINNSIITANGRYGIDVVGGINITLSGNTVKNHTMGIVIRGGTDSVIVKNNLVERSDLQGIALRDLVQNATVQGNTVVGGGIGIYLRDSSGLIDRNVVEEVNNHAITLVGIAAPSTVSHNTVSGTGPSGIDVSRTEGTIRAENDLDGWRSTKPLDVLLRSIFQPLTVMWLSLGLLVLITAGTGMRRKRTGIVHPYANLAPMSTLTLGVVDAADLNQVRTPPAAVADPKFGAHRSEQPPERVLRAFEPDGMELTT